eukprot:4930599-Pyramimonas_sp.AAC.1
MRILTCPIPNIAPHDVRLCSRARAAALEKGACLAQAATREARCLRAPAGDQQQVRVVATPALIPVTAGI